jgi:hypothetical protein
MEYPNGITDYSGVVAYIDDVAIVQG